MHFHWHKRLLTLHYLSAIVSLYIFCWCSFSVLLVFNWGLKLFCISILCKAGSQRNKLMPKSPANHIFPSEMMKKYWCLTWEQATYKTSAQTAIRLTCCIPGTFNNFNFRYFLLKSSNITFENLKIHCFGLERWLSHQRPRLLFQRTAAMTAHNHPQP